MKNLGEGDQENHMLFALYWVAVLGPVDAANIMCSQPKNVNFVKYGDAVSYTHLTLPTIYSV